MEAPVSGCTETARSLQTPPRGPPAAKMDPGRDGPLVQVGPAARLPGGQAHHGHHRHAAVEDDAHVGRAAHGHLLEHVVLDDALLDDGAVGLAAEGIQAGEDHRQVIADLGHVESARRRR